MDAGESQSTDGDAGEVIPGAGSSTCSPTSERGGNHEYDGSLGS
jgi:hypothetical protein